MGEANLLPASLDDRQDESLPSEVVEAVVIPLQFVGQPMSRSFVIETQEQRQRLVSFINARALPVQVDVGDVRKQRTLSQNNRLWKLHGLVAAQTGNSADDMHEEALCRHFGYTEKKMPTGWIKRIPLKRSSPREVQEFGQFMEVTEAWYASEFGVWLGQDET